MAYVRLRADSAVFNGNAGDVVEVADDVAALMVEAGAADAVPAQACRGRKHKPGSLALED